MNNVVLVGRLTGDPEVRYTQDKTAVARYTLAVDRRKKDEADFIRCVAFGKSGEFTEKYFKKGMRVAVQGRIQTGSYKDKDGKTVYTTDIVAENQEFADGKRETDNDGFMSVPKNEYLPFV